VSLPGRGKQSTPFPSANVDACRHLACFSANSFARVETILCLEIDDYPCRSPRDAGKSTLVLCRSPVEKTSLSALIGNISVGNQAIPPASSSSCCSLILRASASLSPFLPQGFSPHQPCWRCSLARPPPPNRDIFQFTKTRLPCGIPVVQGKTTFLQHCVPCSVALGLSPPFSWRRAFLM